MIYSGVGLPRRRSIFISQVVCTLPPILLHHTLVGTLPVHVSLYLHVNNGEAQPRTVSCTCTCDSH